MATRNFSRQNAASGFAELATQQAMANIDLGFNTTGNLTGNLTGNYTAVVTTQPGAIHKYFFQNGTITQNTTVEQFSAGNITINATSTALSSAISNQTANINNLSNPAGSATGNLTLTGNASEQINVQMEDVLDAEGNLVGRVAYYVDDELTKININAATGDRTTLNVSTGRSMSLSALTSNNSTLGWSLSSNQISTFQNIIDGVGGGVEYVTNWGHVFRNEQLSSNTTLNATASQLAEISSAPLSDFHLKYTPWGARRLHINDEPLDITGVQNVYDALSSQHLTNIYGQNFNDKYGQPWSWYGSNTSATASLTTTDLPVNGLRQTAANLLQMRAAGTANHTTGGYNFTGSLVGNPTSFPPSDVLGHTPFGLINEFGINLVYQDYLNNDGRGGIIIYIRPFVEVFAPYPNPYGNVPALFLSVEVNKVTFKVEDAVGRSVVREVGPYTLTKQVGLTGSGKLITNGMTGNPTTTTAPDPDTGEVINEIDFSNISIPFWSMLSQQINCFRNHGQNGNLYNTIDFPWRIVGNVTIEMGDVKLYAGNSPNNSALRDWIPGSVINAILGNGTTQTDISGANNDDNDTKIQNPNSPLPTSFEVRQPICLTSFYEKTHKNGNFVGGNITSYSRHADWPSSTNATLSRVTTNYGNASQAAYNAQYYSRLGNYSYFPRTGRSIKVSNLRDSYTASYASTSGNITITKNCTVTGSSLNDPLAATANLGDANGYQNVTLQRIDPRIRGYGNSTIGYSNFIAAPYTFTRNSTYPALLYMGGSSNNSNAETAGCNTYYGTNTDTYGIQGIRIAELKNRDIPPDPSPLGGNEPEYFTVNSVGWIYLTDKLHALDYKGNGVFISPADLGKVITNLNWRTLRFMPRHQREAARNLIPDWAMLDVISFSSNNATASPLKIAPINPNGSFACNSTLNNSTISPRNNLEALIKPLEIAGNMTGISSVASQRTPDPYFSLGSPITGNLTAHTFPKVDLVTNPTVTINHPSVSTLNPYTYFRGTTPFAASISSNITSNSTTKWSTTNSTWSDWRNARRWPSIPLILPGEVTEIQGVAEYSIDNYNRLNNQYNHSGGFHSFKENENRLCAFFPGLTLQSNFFTIYAYGQAGSEINGAFVMDSEALTKTLVEVEIATPATATTPAQYKVKKLYTQSISMGE